MGEKIPAVSRDEAFEAAAFLKEVMRDKGETTATRMDAASRLIKAYQLVTDEDVERAKALTGKGM